MRRYQFYIFVVQQVLECVWNLMVHGDAREGKWRENWRMEWVASTLTLPRNVVYPALLTLMRTPRLPAFDWTDGPADLNGLVHFGEWRNLVSAHVPSRFKRTRPQDSTDKEYSNLCLINHHEIKEYRGLKVQLHSLTSTPDGDGYSSPTLFASPLLKEPSVLTV